MIRQKAYIQGFCKTAEAYGVDPQKLLKAGSFIAAPGRAIGRFLTAGQGGIGRYMELLTGGNRRLLADYNRLQKWLSLSGKEATGMLGGDPAYYRNMKNTIRDAFLKGNGQSVEIPLKIRGGTARRITATKDIADELGKVWSVRAGTALGGLGLAGGAGYAASKMAKKDKSKSPWFF